MDCLLNNPFPKWIVYYIIHFHMIYFMSRQQLGAYFPAKKGRFKSKMAARGINNVNDALRMIDSLRSVIVEQDADQVNK